jgi:hypothetical protein
MPATASGMMKDGSPTLLSLREQIVSDTSRTAPNVYTLLDGVSFTGLPEDRNGWCPHCFSGMKPVQSIGSGR